MSVVARLEFATREATDAFRNTVEIVPNSPLLYSRLHLLNQESHRLLMWPVSEPGGTIMMSQAFLLPSCMRLRRALSFLDVGVLACAVDAFFSVRVTNPQTQRAYGRSGRQFLDCCRVLTGFPLGSLLGWLALFTAVAGVQPQISYRIDTVAGGATASMNDTFGIGIA